MVALTIRTDLSFEELRRLTRGEADGRICRRLLAIAMALDGVSRKEAARQAGMDRQTLRDWIVRYNAEGVEGLRDRARTGRPPLLAGAGGKAGRPRLFSLHKKAEAALLMGAPLSHLPGRTAISTPAPLMTMRPPKSLSRSL